ncbi:hypothetical protein C4568_03030 [Candidatus Parcubacteria bacterium]|nr:MAG: hypothetical protein C4568_03030 [Candidatus Parcubacteria bacterium]
MLESFISGPRALFKKGGQSSFLLSVEAKIGFQRMIEICDCSARTLRDWKREKFPMPLACATSLGKQAKVPLPRNFLTRERYAHTKKAGLQGAQAVMKKYGRMQVDETKRKQRWHAWWQQEGRFNKHTIATARAIHTPDNGEMLAEFIGIVMGDGGISDYQVTISLHHVTDLPYIGFVTRLIRKLFKVRASVYHHESRSVKDIVVSRKALVDFLHSRGLPIGNKVRQQFDIPEWIKKNPKYARACVRGLVDTDGSVFTHSYRVKGKRYNYKKLSFCSRSRPLQLSVAKILADSGLHPRVTLYDVWLDRKTDVKRYFEVIGSHNPKHLKRYRN